ncbi:zinc finger protein 62-like [Planococcus citri]|uniref:zinc finger protein 62-like n=1 Tax=Planococcus citri TaxID=170843 RepID=UPI0031F99E38
MDYIYKYEDSMRQCETLFTENILKLCNYSMCLLSSSNSSSESTERVKEYNILKKKLDTAQENVTTLKSEYNDLTLHCSKSTSSGINFKEKVFNYLARQETLRLKFIETISECKHINSRLDDILHDCSDEALNKTSNKKTSKRGRSNRADGFDLSSIPKICILLPKLDWDYGEPLTWDGLHLESDSFSKEHAEELCASAAAPAFKSLEVSSSDLNGDVAVKKCSSSSTSVLESKKLKNPGSSKRNEASAPNPNQSLVCNICHRNICNKKQMRRHMFLHESFKPFECAGCGKSFAKKQNMKSHIFSMHMPYQSRPHKCDSCNEFYSYRNNMNNHRCSTTLSNHSTHVSDGRQSLVCNICHKHFSHQQSLKRHMLIHEGLKPFKCAECDKSFRTKANMNQHTRICHTTYHTRPHKCDICDKRYAAEWELNAHKRLAGHYCSSKLSKTSADVDDGLTVKERDSTAVLNAKKVRKLVSSKGKKNSSKLQNSSQFFVCNVCHRNFSRRYDLERHLISHEALKPFKCAECDKSFARKDVMRNHIILMHINDPGSLDSHYCCAHCQYRCRFKEMLVYHIKKNHLSNLVIDEFSCTVCGKTFSTRSSRKFHERTVHVQKKKFLLYDLRLKSIDTFSYSVLSSISIKKYNMMNNIYKYEDSMRQCETLFTENIRKLSNYSSISSSQSTERVKEYEILKKKLDTAKENIAMLKSEYNDLTLHCTKSTASGISYLARQETLRSKFIETINECKHINSRLDDILQYDCSNEALNESSNQNTSKRGRLNTADGFGLSPIPIVCILLPEVGWEYGDSLTSDSHNLESNSFSNEHAEKLCTSIAASVSESLEVSFSDLNSDVCNSTTVLETKKLKNKASWKRNEAPDASQSLVCNICHRSISNMKNMNRHMSLHKGLKPFECADCGKSFTRKQQMKLHIFSIHMPYQSRPFKCDICSKLYSSRSDLKFHKCSTSVKKPKKVSDTLDRRQSLVCSICSKHFSRQQNLKRHMLIHEGVKPFKCAECDKSFRSNYDMNQHINLCHAPYHTRPYKCDICGKRYTAQCDLNTHRRLAGHYCSSKLSEFTSADVDDGVSVEDRDSTTVLGAKKVRKLVSSKRKKNTSKPQTTNDSSQFFACNVCDRNFSKQANLERHLISHEASKPFDCAECDKSFAKKCFLKRHVILAHINDQRSLDSNYYCAHCKYRCRIKESLVYHIKNNHVSNLSLDEVSCSMCGKTFSDSCSRKRHEQTVHVEEICFCCMNCGNRYKHDCSLVKHLELEQCRLK